MFAIRLLPPTQVGPDGQRLGEIVVGAFRETVACHSEDVDTLEIRWRESLQTLMNGDPVVVLRHDARFAWVVYREGVDCFVRQRFSQDGSFPNLFPRDTVTEDGDEVSEWATSLTA